MPSVKNRRRIRRHARRRRSILVLCYQTITTGEGGMICVGIGYRAAITSAVTVLTVRSGTGIPRTRPTGSTMLPRRAGKQIFDVLAAIGRCNSAGRSRSKTRAIARRFSEAFAGYDFLTVPPDGDGHAWHLYLLGIVPELLNTDRDGFGHLLRDAGISISLHFIPHFEQTWCKKRYNLSRSDFPHAARRYDTTLTLPLWPDMEEWMIDQVITTVISIGKAQYRRRP